MFLTLLLLFGLLSTPVATPVGLSPAPTWTVSTGPAMEAHPEAKTGLLVVDDMVIVASRGRTLLALDTRTGAPVWSSVISEDIFAPMAATGGTLLVPGDHGTLVIVDVATGKVTREVVLGAEPLLEPLLIGESIVVSDVRGTVHIVDEESFETQATIVTGGKVKHVGVAGDLAIFASAGGMVTAIRPATASEEWQAVVAGKPVQLQVSGDGIAIGLDSGDLMMLNAADGTIRWQQALVASPFTDIAYAGSEVVAITTAGDLLIMDMATGAPSWREVLPSGGGFAGNDCDPGCPVVTYDGSVYMFLPTSREHPMPATVIQEVAVPPVATRDVLVVVTEQGDVHGWVLNQG